MNKTEKLLHRTPTPAQSAAARANGSKSRGPVTVEGKRNSRRNALKHGQSAQTLTLDRESDDGFALTLAAFEADYQPRTETERNLVFRIAHAHWRSLRLWSQEKSIFNEAMEEIRRSTREPGLRSDACSGRAFRQLADSGPVLALLDRHENRYERIYHRAVRQLSRLREEPFRLERLRQLAEGTGKNKFKNVTTNPPTATKQNPAQKTNPDLTPGPPPDLMKDWRPSEELEARIAAFNNRKPGPA